MPHTDVTQTVEQLPEMEPRLKVTISGVSAFIRRDDFDNDAEEESDNESTIAVEVRGELAPLSGSKIGCDMEIVATVHDDQGRVIGKGSEYLDAEEFFGLECFDLSIDVPSDRIAKVKVYPKKS